MTTLELEQHMEGLREGLTADGYDMRFGEGIVNGKVRIEIVAGPDACPDCLVPKDMMEMMVRAVLEDAGAKVDAIELAYPRELAA